MKTVFTVSQNQDQTSRDQNSSCVKNRISFHFWRLYQNYSNVKYMRSVLQGCQIFCRALILLNVSNSESRIILSTNGTI